MTPEGPSIDVYDYTAGIVEAVVAGEINPKDPLATALAEILQDQYGGDADVFDFERAVMEAVSGLPADAPCYVIVDVLETWARNETNPVLH